jgi:hypothetical protein
VRLSLLGTSATNWSIVPASDMINDDECGEVGGMKTGRGNRSTRKTFPMPFCPPQIPHDLTWARTLAAAVGSRRLTAWVMARPVTHLVTVTVYPVRGLKGPELAADHSPPSSAEVKISGVIPPSPHSPSCCGAYLVKHRDKFYIFTFKPHTPCVEFSRVMVSRKIFAVHSENQTKHIHMFCG